jgi:hypothetical protein
MKRKVNLKVLRMSLNVLNGVPRSCLDPSKSLYYENQRPFCETNNVWWNISSTLKVLCSNQNSKSKDLMVQFKVLNIHINHKVQLAIKGAPHGHIYRKNANLNMIWHGFWLISSCFYPFGHIMCQQIICYLTQFTTLTIFMNIIIHGWPVIIGVNNLFQNNVRGKMSFNNSNV